jgi:hypothetical protein
MSLCALFAVVFVVATRYRVSAGGAVSLGEPCAASWHGGSRGRDVIVPRAAMAFYAAARDRG